MAILTLHSAVVIIYTACFNIRNLSAFHTHILFMQITRGKRSNKYWSRILQVEEEIVYLRRIKKNSYRNFWLFVQKAVDAYPEQDCVTSYDSSSPIVPVWRAVFQALHKQSCGFSTVLWPKYRRMWFLSCSFHTTKPMNGALHCKTLLWQFCWSTEWSRWKEQCGYDFSEAGSGSFITWIAVGVHCDSILRYNWIISATNVKLSLSWALLLPILEHATFLTLYSYYVSSYEYVSCCWYGLHIRQYSVPMHSVVFTSVLYSQVWWRHAIFSIRVLR